MDYLDEAIRIATEAGAILSSHFYSGFSHTVTIKTDQSPVTQADFASNNHITTALKKLNADIPILSEENTIPDFAERKTWNRYWLIDPLDGTKGFITRSAEFCVNIALIENHKPILGVIYSPIEKITYFAEKNKGAFLMDSNNVTTALSVSNPHSQTVRFLCGPGDCQPDYLSTLKKKYKHVTVTKMNSALKFGLIAAGKADLYVRFGPTCEWDTAAGQCIVVEAGGQVVDFQGQPLQYNAKESLVNPAFRVSV